MTVASIAMIISMIKLRGERTSVITGEKIVAIFDIVTHMPIAVDVKMVG